MNEMRPPTNFPESLPVFRITSQKSDAMASPDRDFVAPRADTARLAEAAFLTTLFLATYAWLSLQLTVGRLPLVPVFLLLPLVLLGLQVANQVVSFLLGHGAWKWLHGPAPGEFWPWWSVRCQSTCLLTTMVLVSPSGGFGKALLLVWIALAGGNLLAWAWLRVVTMHKRS